MRELEFTHSSEIAVDATTLDAWHRRPGAFARLAPPWERVDLVGAPAQIEVGARQSVLVGLGGPLRMRWDSVIEASQPGQFFRDVQSRGPFASWVHTHSMEPRGESQARLIDLVRYVLPFGVLGRWFGAPHVRRKLERMFVYRHTTTAGDLAQHATAPPRSMQILVTGATGLVGSALTPFLTTGGHRVRRLVRRAPRTPDEFRWDPDVGKIDAKAFEGVDAVVHLAGEGIAARRWSAVQKDRIRRSRREGTRLIANAIRAAKNGPSVLVSAAAIGIYGDRGEEELTEASAHGTGFLAEVCGAWEAESLRLSGVRAVQLRFGVILSAGGGALKKMLLPFRLGAGGKLGSGAQWMSWVALDDVIGAVHHALVTPKLCGPVNVVAPGTVTNADFTSALGRVLKRPTVLPMPAFAARVVFGEMADELLLASQKVKPTRLEEGGYQFRFPNLEGALRHTLGK